MADPFSMVALKLGAFCRARKTAAQQVLPLFVFVGGLS